VKRDTSRQIELIWPVRVLEDRVSGCSANQIRRLIRKPPLKALLQMWEKFAGHLIQRPGDSMNHAEMQLQETIIEMGPVHDSDGRSSPRARRLGQATQHDRMGLHGKERFIGMP